MPTRPKTIPQPESKAPAGKTVKPTAKHIGPTTWKKGDPRASQAGKIGGRPAGSASVLSDAKRKWLTQTGQTPLDFLTAVYRNQLYEDYEVEVIDEKKGLVRLYPRLDPVTGAIAVNNKHIPVEIERRIAAATAAAPYVHRKMPIGIDGGEGKPLAFVSADQLAKLSDGELAKLLEIMGRLGIGAEFEGGAQVPPSMED